MSRMNKASLQLPVQCAASAADSSAQALIKTLDKQLESLAVSSSSFSKCKLLTAVSSVCVDMATLRRHIIADNCRKDVPLAVIHNDQQTATGLTLLSTKLPASLAQLITVLDASNGKPKSSAAAAENVKAMKELLEVLILDIQKFLKEHPHLVLGNPLVAQEAIRMMMDCNSKGILPILQSAASQQLLFNDRIAGVVSIASLYDYMGLIGQCLMLTPQHRIPEKWPRILQAMKDAAIVEHASRIILQRSWADPGTHYELAVHAGTIVTLLGCICQHHQQGSSSTMFASLLQQVLNDEYVQELMRAVLISILRPASSSRSDQPASATSAAQELPARDSSADSQADMHGRSSSSSKASKKPARKQNQQAEMAGGGNASNTHLNVTGHDLAKHIDFHGADWDSRHHHAHSQQQGLAHQARQSIISSSASLPDVMLQSAQAILISVCKFSPKWRSDPDTFEQCIQLQYMQGMSAVWPQPEDLVAWINGLPVQCQADACTMTIKVVMRDLSELPAVAQQLGPSALVGQAQPGPSAGQSATHRNATSGAVHAQPANQPSRNKAAGNFALPANQSEHRDASSVQRFMNDTNRQRVGTPCSAANKSKNGSIAGGAGNCQPCTGSPISSLDRLSVANQKAAHSLSILNTVAQLKAHSRSHATDEPWHTAASAAVLAKGGIHINHLWTCLNEKRFAGSLERHVPEVLGIMEVMFRQVPLSSVLHTSACALVVKVMQLMLELYVAKTDEANQADGTGQPQDRFPTTVESESRMATSQTDMSLPPAVQTSQHHRATASNNVLPPMSTSSTLPIQRASTATSTRTAASTSASTSAAATSASTPASAAASAAVTNTRTAVEVAAAISMPGSASRSSPQPQQHNERSKQSEDALATPQQRPSDATLSVSARPSDASNHAQRDAGCSALSTTDMGLRLASTVTSMRKFLVRWCAQSDGSSSMELKGYITRALETITSRCSMISQADMLHPGVSCQVYGPYSKLAIHCTSAALDAFHDSMRSANDPSLRSAAKIAQAAGAAMVAQATHGDAGHILGCWHPGCTNLSGGSEAELKLQSCSGCKAARYCCRECQTAHWREHKGLCKLPAAQS